MAMARAKKSKGIMNSMVLELQKIEHGKSNLNSKRSDSDRLLLVVRFGWRVAACRRAAKSPAHWRRSATPFAKSISNVFLSMFGMFHTSFKDGAGGNRALLLVGARRNLQRIGGAVRHRFPGLVPVCEVRARRNGEAAFGKEARTKILKPTAFVFRLLEL